MDVAPVPAGCPRCNHGSLVKHCPPTNVCDWWVCDIPCGYGVDLASGRDTTLLRRSAGSAGVDSGGRGED